jgi:hypothetical protein
MRKAFGWRCNVQLLAMRKRPGVVPAIARSQT